MQLSVDQCEYFLRAMIEVVEETNPDEVNDPLIYLPLDTILSAWLLQNKYGEVDRDLLNRLVGSTLTDKIDTFLRTELWKYVAGRDIRQSSFQFSNEMMRAIENVYSQEDLSYQILDYLPGFNAYILKHDNQFLLGYEFLEYINSLRHSEIGRLTEVVALAFANRIPNTNVSTPFPERYPDIYLVESRDYAWAFVVSVRPALGTLSKSDYTEAIFHLSATMLLLQGKYSDRVKGILLGPDVNEEEAFQIASTYPYIYYLWSISAIRFFHMLDQVKDKANSERLAANFSHIFPSEPTGRLWARAAILRLRKAVGLANYLVRIVRFSDDKVGYTYSVALKQTSECYVLDRDYSNKFENKEIFSVKVNGIYHECIVVEHSEHIKLEANLHWKTAKEVSELEFCLDERQILIAAIAKYLR